MIRAVGAKRGGLLREDPYIPLPALYAQGGSVGRRAQEEQRTSGTNSRRVNERIVCLYKCVSCAVRGNVATVVLCASCSTPS